MAGQSSTSAKNLRFAGAMFVVAAIAWFAADNVALGAAFVAIGAAMIAMSMQKKDAGDAG